VGAEAAVGAGVAASAGVVSLPPGLLLPPLLLPRCRNQYNGPTQPHTHVRAYGAAQQRQ
jgi:hypothetical protein